MSRSFSKSIKIFIIAFLCVSLGLITPGGRLARALPAVGNSVVFIPGTVSVPPEVEDALRSALQEALPQLPASQYWAVTHLSELGAYSLVSVAGLNGVGEDLAWTMEKNYTWPGLVLLRHTGEGGWKGAVRGTPAFTSMLDEIPEEVLSQPARLGLDPTKSAGRPDETLRFPWADNTKMQYGVSGVHSAGFAGVVGSSNWKAVDLFTDGNTAAGHAPNSLLAAESGSIWHVCWDGTSAAIFINSLIYAHLQNNANLAEGHYFAQGEHMASLRTGNFSDTCGTASQNAGWGHVHWGFPYGNGTFTAGGWTLSLSDGQWRRGSETRGTLSWFNADPPSTTLQVIVEDPSLSPGYGSICDTHWYRFSNNRGHYAYLTLNTNDSNQSTNSASWRPNLPQAGYYRVEALVAYHPSIDWTCPSKHISYDTSDAHYDIFYAGGSTRVEANQRPLNDQWLDLGEFLFAAGTGGSAVLTDVNHEANISYTINFSAMRFTWTRAAPSKAYLPLVSNNASYQENPLTVKVLNQPAFDKCEIPSVSQMQTWWDSSPYRIINLYMGGISRGCSNSGLNATWVASVRDQGWAFIPTWVGPQAPCTALSHPMSYDTTTAYNQGRSEAEAALAAASSLGLVGSNGTVLYYDMEGYPGSSNQACRDAVNAFVSGWSGRLNELGHKAGVYGSACSSFVSDWASISHGPNDIWPASWYASGYDPTANTSVPCVSSGLWNNHQRIRQYAGGHSEQWGSLSMTIDSNIADGEVVAPAASYRTEGPTPFPPDEGATLASGGTLGEGWMLQNGQLAWLQEQGGLLTIPGPDSGPEGIRAAFFADSLQGWALAGQPPVLWHTGDGGLSWQKIALPDFPTGPAYQPVSLGFSGAGEVGWLTLRPEASPNFRQGLLWITADGGSHWQSKALPGSGPARLLTSEQGWALGGPDDGDLFRTQDGGGSWELVALPGIPDDAVYGLPAFSTPSRGYLPIGTETGSRLYLTGDGGQSWQAGASLPEGTLEVAFVSDQVGWALARHGTCQGEKARPGTFACTMGMQVWHTRDGGLTWLPLPGGLP